jgi:1,3-beta-glucanosyltransferase GAS5
MVRQLFIHVSILLDNSENRQSGYNQLVELFSNYSAPLFFSEYGCNLVQPRVFTEVESICSSHSCLTDLDSSDMTGVFSGGLVYEWTEEPDNYGLVNLQNGNITFLQDYYNLKAEFQAVPLPTGTGGYNPNGAASTCPANSSDFTSWGDNLPAIPSAAAVYIQEGAGQALGFNGPSNQGAGSTVLPLSEIDLL